MNVRTILLALAALFAIAFAACGDDDDNAASQTASPAAATSAAASATAKPVSFSCSAPPAATAPDDSQFPLTLTDSAGRTVTIEKAPQKIAAMDAAHTEVLYAIGA